MGIQYWQRPSTGTTKDSGFSCIAGGRCNYGIEFYGIGNNS